MKPTSAGEVNEGIRRQFESDWKEGQPRGIEDYLPAEDDPGLLATLEELIHIELELAWKSYSGARANLSADAAERIASPPAPLESYLERFPGLLAVQEALLRLVRQEVSVRRRYDGLFDLSLYQQRFPQLNLGDDGLLARSEFDETPFLMRGADTLALEGAAGVLPQQFGPYELVRQLGRGGMGTVYLARQLGAERDVALKVIALDRLSPSSAGDREKLLIRFTAEAKAAARLSHENIVTVYDVGQVDGRYYYAMRYVDGPSLAEIVRHGPLVCRRAAAYMEAVARGVHEAHRHGLLHRDLKPHNILVDRRTDRPLVTDFGLVKWLDTASELTRSGEIVGTPSYMSPEQTWDAARVTPASDVYSLGATLYSLLAARPPFQAADSLSTLLQVRQDEPLRPGQLNPAIDRDLETICLKCLQKEPARRYASAGALADDLRRYLDGRPVLARRVGAMGQTMRWARRNPLSASLAGLAAICLLLVFGVGAAGYFSTAAALRKYRESFAQARQAVDDLHMEVSEDVLLNQPGMDELRERLLRRALQHYQWFIEQRRDDPSLQEQLAGTHFRIARISEAIDSPAAAIEHYEQAIELARQQPAGQAQLAALADMLNAHGSLLCQLQQYGEARAKLEEARSLREQLAQPSNRAARRKLANTYMNLGILAKAQGHFDDAAQAVRKAQQMRETLLSEDAHDALVLIDLAKGHYGLGTLALAMDQQQEAITHLQRAVSTFAEVINRQSENRQVRALQIQSRRVLAHALQLDLQWEAALDEYAHAREAMETLAQENPRVLEYRAELAAVLLELAGLQGQQQLLEQAVGTLNRSVELLTPLAPAQPRYQRDLGVALRELGLLHLKRQDVPTARQALQRSREQLQSLIERFPNDRGYALDLEPAVKLLEQLLASGEVQQEN